MTQELLYTSAPRGLKLGAKGFCTVASTAGMPATLAERLESLSGYRHLHPPHDKEARLNPIQWSHLIIKLGGQVLHVLSRVCDAGLDYSQRSNKLAHHVALTEAELAPAGPAWLLSSPGFMETSFVGEPRILPAGRQPPQGSAPPRVCRAWEAASGDAGWAGVLAEAAADGTPKIVNIIYPAGAHVLSLVEEAMALLPAARRWAVTFSTYYTKLPPGIDCHWRFLVDGEAEARTARRTPQIPLIDLCSGLGAAEGGPLVSAARTGHAPKHVPATAEPTASERAAAGSALHERGFRNFEPNLASDAVRAASASGISPRQPAAPAGRPAPPQLWPTINPSPGGPPRRRATKRMLVAAGKAFGMILLVAGAFAVGEWDGGRRGSPRGGGLADRAKPAAIKVATADAPAGVHAEGRKKSTQSENTLASKPRSNQKPTIRPEKGDPAEDKGSNPKADSPSGGGTGDVAAADPAEAPAPVKPGGLATPPPAAPKAQGPAGAGDDAERFADFDRKLHEFRGLGLDPPDYGLNAKSKNHRDLVELRNLGSEPVVLRLHSPKWDHGNTAPFHLKGSGPSDWELMAAGASKPAATLRMKGSTLSFDWATNVPDGDAKRILAEAWLRIKVGEKVKTAPLANPAPLAEYEFKSTPRLHEIPEPSQLRAVTDKGRGARLEIRHSAGASQASKVLDAGPPVDLFVADGIKFTAEFANSRSNKEGDKIGVQIRAFGELQILDNIVIVSKEHEELDPATLSDLNRRLDRRAQEIAQMIQGEKGAQQLDALKRAGQDIAAAQKLCETQQRKLAEAAKMTIKVRIFKATDIEDDPPR